MDFIKNIKSDTIIICNNDNKLRLLEYISNQKEFYPIKFMNFDELTKNYYFDYDKKALIYIMKKLNIKYSIAKVYLQNLYYIEEKKYNNEKLEFLKNLKLDLMNQKMLKTNEYFTKTLKNKKIIVYGFNYINLFDKSILTKLSSVCNIEIINKKYSHYPHEIYKFNTIEEEIEFVANSICKLIEQGIKPKNIKLTNISENYYNVLEKIFNFYNLKINANNRSSIISSDITKFFLDNYQSDISKTLEMVKAKYKDEEIINKIVNICNKYVFIDNYLEIKELIVEDLKNTIFDRITYKNGIDIIDYLEYESGEDYVFMLNFNQGSIPKINKDEEYLTDDIKIILNIETSYMKNKIVKEATINNIKSMKNLVITYKEKDAFKSYYPSPLIEEIPLKEQETKEENLISYSKINDEINLAKSLDNFIKYGERSKNLSILYSSYKIPYSTYDNNYKSIEKNTFLEYIDQNLKLSYTTLDSYFKCGFKYYLDNILKLNIYEEKLTNFIGNLFHHILEIGITNDIDFDLEFNKYIKQSNKIFSFKDKFFIKKLKEELMFTLETIKEQEKLSNLNNYFLEDQIIIKIPGEVNITFIGKIDKIMYKKSANNTLVALVDYKTGSTSCDLKYLKYGINMQLPIYLYLAQNNKKIENAIFTGFYLQRIHNKKSSLDIKKNYIEERKSKLKLNGYSNSDETILKEFDKTYKDSTFISGMGIKLDGSFKSSAKILNNKQIINLIKYTEIKIKEAAKEILDTQFNINPKRDEKGDLISCKFCKYKDICFKKEENIISVEADNDLTFLGGDNNELDN